MNCKELRIGNYVKVKRTGDIVCVCAITKRKIGYHAPNERPNAHLRYCNFHEIEGVPFLDMFPTTQNADVFEVITERYYTCDKSVHISTTNVLKDGNLAVMDGLYFKYAHELQNYRYARYGEELVFNDVVLQQYNNQ